MPVTRIFMDWKQPMLPATAAFLQTQYVRDGALDLEQVVIVTAGARAGRRLLELLVDLADKQELALVPPTFVTTGALPELLYQPTLPLASDTERALAWLEALRSAPPEQIQTLMPSPPAADQIGEWLRFARTLDELSIEIGAGGWSFDQVGALVAECATEQECQRWEALAAIEQYALEVLEQQGLTTRERARLEAVQGERCECSRDVVLVATHDLSSLAARMLEKLPGAVYSLVHAPDSIADRFDAIGCVVPSAWAHAMIPVDDEMLCIVESSVAFGEVLAREIATLPTQYHSSDIVVGVVNEQLMPLVAAHLSAAGITARQASATSVDRTLLGALLAAAAELLSTTRTRELGTFVRHPDVLRWLQARGLERDAREVIDSFHDRHLQASLAQLTPSGLPASADDDARALFGMLHDLLAPLLASPRPLRQWAGPLAEFIVRLYGDRRLSSAHLADAELIESLEVLQRVLSDFERLPKESGPPLAAWSAVQVVLHELRKESISAPHADGIEVLGWLELQLDDAPVHLIAGANEGHLPSVVAADPFLPDSLRTRLGLADNARRYARDAASLAALCASREVLRLVAARHDAQQGALKLSRLLLACPPAQQATRVLGFYQPEVVEKPQLDRLAPGGFGLPARPLPLEAPVDELAVTDFRAYLRCPYRFYLERVLRLRPLNDLGIELDAPRFGTLLHEVLADFAASEERHADSERAIAEMLSALLDARVRTSFGQRMHPAVAVQVENLRARLRRFARWQAARRAEGWEIHSFEVDLSHLQVRLDAGPHQVRLKGCIDRIDFNPGTGQWAVLDYKSSDNQVLPEKLHRNKEEWTDVQLPLYHYLVTSAGICESAELGYVNLGGRDSDIGLAVATWDETELEQALNVARRVAQSICEGCFWPPRELRDSFDPFAALCGELVAPAAVEYEEAW